MNFVRVLLPLLTLPALSLLADGPPRSLGDLTGSWHLALDSRVWDSRGAAQLRFHAFEKHTANPVLRATQPWEGRHPYVYGTVLPDEQGAGLRMWYHAYVADRTAMPGNHRYTNLYATSKDGLHWTKPALGLFPFQGAAANNIFFSLPEGPGSSHAPNVIHTPWEQDPGRRYKLITYYYYDGYHGATSPDGIHWTNLPEKRILEDPGDVGNFVWDSRRGAYIGYPKKFSQVRGFRRRCVGFSETSDFARWPESRLILAPDEEDDRGYLTAEGHTDFYGLAAFPYQTMYVGFLWIYRIEKGDERVWPELVFGPDGIHWNRVPSPRAPVLDLGQAGTWDDGMIYTTNHPIIRDGRVQLYYGGMDGPHNGRDNTAGIGLASMRRDGFAGLAAVDTETAITTVAFRNAAGALRVNANARGGSLRAELLDTAGKPMPGYTRNDSDTLTGDRLEQTLKWKSRGALPEGAFRIRFWLRNAELFSFHAGEAAMRVDTDNSR